MNTATDAREQVTHFAPPVTLVSTPFREYRAHAWLLALNSPPTTTSVAALAFPVMSSAVRAQAQAARPALPVLQESISFRAPIPASLLARITLPTTILTEALATLAMASVAPAAEARPTTASLAGRGEIVDPPLRSPKHCTASCVSDNGTFHDGSDCRGEYS